MTTTTKVRCPHCKAMLKPKFASNHIHGTSNEGGCKVRTHLQAERDKVTT